MKVPHDERLYTRTSPISICPPEVVAQDILTSFSTEGVDDIINILQEGRNSMSSDCRTQGVFPWKEGEERWNQSGENQIEP